MDITTEEKRAKFAIPTGMMKEIENYPYGYTLKTTLYDSMEFHPKKGYRRIKQTINPKTGRANKPKKGTYYSFYMRYENQETGHIDSITLDFNGSDSMVYGLKQIAEFIKYDVLSPEEIDYLQKLLLSMIKVHSHSLVVYCGAKWEDIKPIISPVVELLVYSIRNKENCLLNIDFPAESLEALKVPDFNPFTIKTYTIY